MSATAFASSSRRRFSRCSRPSCRPFRLRASHSSSKTQDSFLALLRRLRLNRAFLLPWNNRWNIAGPAAVPRSDTWMFQLQCTLFSDSCNVVRINSVYLLLIAHRPTVILFILLQQSSLFYVRALLMRFIDGQLLNSHFLIELPVDIGRLLYVTVRPILSWQKY